MQIGTLAEAAGVTTKTIRFYEHRGLLHPPPRTRGGYRDYPAEAVPRLQFIRNAQSAGLGLAEIQGVLAVRDSGQAPCGEVAALIAEHLDQIEHRLADLRAARSALRDLARAAADLDPDTCAEADICIVFTGVPRTY
ncbi:MAG: heavy metal-responsive transcriptional regulator [Sporichthyaceae bacterium]